MTKCSVKGQSNLRRTGKLKKGKVISKEERAAFFAEIQGKRRSSQTKKQYENKIKAFRKFLLEKHHHVLII